MHAKRFGQASTRKVAAVEVALKAGLVFAKPCFEVTFNDDMVAVARSAWLRFAVGLWPDWPCDCEKRTK